MCMSAGNVAETASENWQVSQIGPTLGQGWLVDISNPLVCTRRGKKDQIGGIWLESVAINLS